MKDDSFKDYILDQLRNMEYVDSRSMFGGYGLYYRSIFFGIVYKGSLYFKTSDATRDSYIDMSMKPFKPNDKQTLSNYYEAPVDIIECESDLIDWAERALASA